MLACVAALPYLTSRRVILPRSSPLLVVLALGSGITFLQWIPLPGGLVQWLSPNKYDLLSFLAKATGERIPAFFPLSYDPPATLVALATLLGYFAFAFICTRIAGSSRGRYWLQATVAGTAFAVAIISELHLAVDATKVFGIFDPGRGVTALGPLINENHLAALLSMAVPVSLGIATKSSRSSQYGWIAIAIVCAGVVLRTGSRGGAIGLFVGIVTTSALLFWKRRASETRPISASIQISMVVIVLCAATLFVLVIMNGLAEFIPPTEAELHTPDGKFFAWRSAIPLIGDHPWTGVGRGAFQYVFPRYHPTTNYTFSHIENQYLQVLADWGVVTVIAIGAAACVSFAQNRQWSTHTLEAGALGGVLDLQSTKSQTFLPSCQALRYRLLR